LILFILCGLFGGISLSLWFKGLFTSAIALENPLPPLSLYSSLELIPLLPFLLLGEFAIFFLDISVPL